MKTVTYPRSLQWVGDLACPACDGLTPAWRSSGMSNGFRHVYCDACSNVIQRDADQALVWAEQSQAILDRVAATLPACPCGGRFQPGAGPKCRHCGHAVRAPSDPVTHLLNPNRIVVDGACAFSDSREPYRVRIVER